MNRNEEGVFIVWIIHDGNEIECSCHLMKKTGIGCSYIFKVLICLKMSLFKGIREMES